MLIDFQKHFILIFTLRKLPMAASNVATIEPRKNGSIHINGAHSPTGTRATHEYDSDISTGNVPRGNFALKELRNTLR